MAKPRNIDWDSQPLGKTIDRILAKKLGVSIATVHRARKVRNIEPFVKRKNIDWDEQPLGIMSDAELARKLGVSVTPIKIERKKRGIGPLYSNQKKGINWDEQPLGEMGDLPLAKQLGVAKSSVHPQRVKRGIKPYEPEVVCAICGEVKKRSKRSSVNHNKYCSTKCRDMVGIVKNRHKIPNGELATAWAKLNLAERKAKSEKQ
jgi:endogenous inhibitor of DNA gyrase (YacG/DUF329 family)